MKKIENSAVRRTNSNKEALYQSKLRKAKENFSDIMNDVRYTGRGNFKQLRKASDLLGKNWLIVQSEINRLQGEWLRKLKKNPKPATVEAIKKRYLDNPFKSEAQRRKFYAMAERGEISQAELNKFNRETKGRKLPERKKPNSTTSDFKKWQQNKLKDLSNVFQGEVNGKRHRLLESDFTPNDKYRLGQLVQLKIKANGATIPINFDGDSMLSGDLRNNLHIVGKDSRLNPSNLRQYGITPPKSGQLVYLGKLVQFDYVTRKKHIENGELVRYYHKPGEVTKELPNAFVDSDGFVLLFGGGYDVWDVGVVN